MGDGVPVCATNSPSKMAEQRKYGFRRREDTSEAAGATYMWYVVNCESFVRCTITSPQVRGVRLDLTSCISMRTHKILICRDIKRVTTNPRLRTKSSHRGTSTGTGEIIFYFFGEILKNK